MVQLNGTTNATENEVSITRKSAILFDMSPLLDSCFDHNLKQFASAYTARLSELSKDLVKKATKKWSKSTNNT